MNTRFGILGSGWIVRRYGEASRLCTISNSSRSPVATGNGRPRRRDTTRIPRAYGGYEALLADREVDA